MKVARSVAEILSQHTTLALECVDRLYVNVYVPVLQRAAGAAYFFRTIRGCSVPSSALMAPMTQRFVAAIKRFAERDGIDIVSFRRGERKDDRTQTVFPDPPSVELSPRRGVVLADVLALGSAESPAVRTRGFDVPPSSRSSRLRRPCFRVAARARRPRISWMPTSTMKNEEKPAFEDVLEFPLLAVLAQRGPMLVGDAISCLMRHFGWYEPDVSDPSLQRHRWRGRARRLSESGLLVTPAVRGAGLGNTRADCRTRISDLGRAELTRFLDADLRLDGWKGVLIQMQCIPDLDAWIGRLARLAAPVADDVFDPQLVEAAAAGGVLSLSRRDLAVSLHSHWEPWLGAWAARASRRQSG